MQLAVQPSCTSLLVHRTGGFEYSTIGCAAVRHIQTQFTHRIKVYIYIYMYMYARTRTHIHTHIYIYIFTYIHIYVQIYIYTNIQAYKHKYANSHCGHSWLSNLPVPSFWVTHREIEISMNICLDTVGCLTFAHLSCGSDNRESKFRLGLVMNTVGCSTFMHLFSGSHNRGPQMSSILGFEHNWLFSLHAPLF